MSRYGQIEINKSHVWCSKDGFKITPYMRDLMLHSGQDDNYQASSDNLRKYLRVDADDSQLNRLCVHYGTALEEEMLELEGEIFERSKSFASEVEEEEVVYGMFDGCMLPTRPHKIGEEEIGSWKEMKLGRIFREQDHLVLGKKPNLIRKSLYVSHFGKHDVFTNKLEIVVDVFESLGKRLIFINDGAPWIENWIQETYPFATDILDFYHASEYLHNYSKAIFSKQTASKEREKWVSERLAELLNDGVEQVITHIKKMVFTKKKLEAQQKILNYYTNNQHRMLYKTYRNRGLLIGSGPIESAHRFVLQKRMKQSGQKWTKTGGQAVANLRVVFLNNQWDRVVSLINQPFHKAA